MRPDQDTVFPPPVRSVRRRRKDAPRARKEPQPPFGQGLFPLLDPLMVKELKGLSRHWRNHVGRVLHVGIVACVLLRWWSEVATHPGRYTTSDYFVGAGFLVLSTIIGAVLFGTEKDGMKVDMLLSTPLSNAQIVGTKLFAGLCSPESLVALGLWVATVWGWFPKGTVAVAGASLLFLLFAYALGAAAALHAKSVRGAVLISLILMLVFGVPWVADVLFPLGGGAAASLPGRVANGSNVVHVLGQFRPNPQQTGPPSPGMVLPFCAIYGGLTLAMVAAIFLRFRGTTGRARG